MPRICPSRPLVNTRHRIIACLLLVVYPENKATCILVNHGRVAPEGKLASPTVKRITIPSIIITGMITEVTVTLLIEMETKLIRIVMFYNGTVVKVTM